MAKVVIPVTADVKEARRELDKIEDKKKQLEARKIKLGLDEEKIRLDLQKIDNDIATLQEKMANKEATSINLGADVEYQGMTRQMDLLYQKGDLYASRLEVAKYEANQTTQEYDKQVQKQQQLGTQIDKNKNKQQDMNNKQKEHSFHLEDIIKKVGRWGLAIIGVRSAYSGIRSAISLVSGSNEEVAKKLEQMRNVIAGALTPLVQFIVGLLMKAMVYINYITKALFGKEIFNFSDATKKASNNLGTASKNAKGTAKALEKAKKQLAGFDEMTTLSDENSSGGGGSLGGAGGVDASVPNYFDKLGEIKIPDWLQKLTKWIKDAIDWFNKLDPVWKKLIATAGLLIGSYVLGGKASGLLGISGILSGFAKLGAVALGVELVYTALTGRQLHEDLIQIIQDYIDLKKVQKDQGEQTASDTKKVTDSFQKRKIKIIENVKAGKQLTEQDYIWIRALQDQILKLKNLKNPTREQKQELRNLTQQYADLGREGVLNNTQMDFYNLLTDKSIKNEQFRKDALAQLIVKQNEEYTASKNQANGVNKTNEAYKGSTIWVDKYGISLQNITQQMGLTKDQTTRLQTALDKYKENPSKKALQELNAEIEKVGKQAGLSKEDIWKLKQRISELKSKKIDVKADVKTEVDTKSLNNTIAKISKGVGNAIKTLFGAKGMVIGYAKGGIIPYASGGIINQPGRGVPLPIGGEHGMEGVIPLTDSQQMALLGEAIGKYITINANITNTMNGRVLSRELQKIQNEEAFGSNRW